MKKKPVDPLRAVRVCLSNGVVEINFYRWVRGQHFAREIIAAEKRKWIQDVGGRNRGIRYYQATELGKQQLRATNEKT